MLNLCLNCNESQSILAYATLWLLKRKWHFIFSTSFTPYYVYLNLSTNLDVDIFFELTTGAFSAFVSSYSIYLLIQLSALLPVFISSSLARSAFRCASKTHFRDVSQILKYFSLNRSNTSHYTKYIMNKYI